MVLTELLFCDGKGYEDLVLLLQSNPRFVFKIHTEDRTDRRTRQARLKG